MCSALGMGREVGLSLIAVVIAGWRRSRFSSETSKAERRSSGDHGSIWDSWPIAFSGYPRGPRVLPETRCPRHTTSTEVSATRSRTRVSRELDGYRRRRFPAWEQIDQRRSSCLWFQMMGVEAHSFLSDDQSDRGNFSG